MTQPDGTITLLQELKIFARHIFYWLISFVGFSLFFFLVGLRKVSLLGSEYFLPLPTENSFSVAVFNMAREDLLPKGVELIATNPISAFISQILLSMLLSFLLTTPFLIYRIITYIRPALMPHERVAVWWSLLPLALLFFAGCAFSYFFLIPATFRILYPYTTILGVMPLFSLDEFSRYVFGLMVAVGIMFLMPVFMVLFSFAGILSADVWRRNWRYAFLFFLVASAIITPDGTGITMIMLFLPLSALYFTGYVFASRFH